MQSRLKSKVLWITIASLVLSVLIRADVITVSDSQFISNLIASVLDILAGLGIFNNPTDAQSF